jgi:hypothetical protein
LDGGRLTGSLLCPRKSRLVRADRFGKLVFNRMDLCHRLSRHANRYKGDLRTSWAAVLDRPMSASSRSSSSRSCLYWRRRSHHSAIPASDASGIFQDHLRSGNEGEAASRVLVELQVALPQGMFHLHNGAKQRLAAGAHRAVVNGPSDFDTTPTLAAQAKVSAVRLGCGADSFLMTRFLYANRRPHRVMCGAAFAEKRFKGPRPFVRAGLDLDGQVVEALQAAEAALVGRRQQRIVRDQRDHRRAVAWTDLPQMQVGDAVASRRRAAPSIRTGFPPKSRRPS